MASDVLYQRGRDGAEEGDSDAWDDTLLIKAYDNAVSAMKAKLVAQHPEYSTSNGATVSKKKKRSKQRTKQKKQNKSKLAQSWSVGDYCQAEFTEDGHIYSAQVISLDDKEGTCIVRYIGYGNEEEQNLDSLLPALSEPSSQDNKTDTASEVESTSDIPKEKHPSRRKSSRGTYVGGQSSKHSAPTWNWNNFAVPPPPPPSAGHHFPTFPPSASFPPSGFGAPPQFPPMFPGIPPPPPMFNSPEASNENEALYSMLISWYMSGYHTGYYQGMKSAKSTSMFPGPHR